MGPRIVVAEDNPTFRGMLLSMLKLHGYAPVAAADGHEALLAVKEGTPSAVLLDVSLPGMSGVRVAEALRAQPEWRELPIIGMSGYDLAEDEAEWFTAFLHKPLVLAELMALLSDLIPRTDPDS